MKLFNDLAGYLPHNIAKALEFIVAYPNDRFKAELAFRQVQSEINLVKADLESVRSTNKTNRFTKLFSDLCDRSTDVYISCIYSDAWFYATTGCIQYLYDLQASILKHKENIMKKEISE